jgi:sporulation protein YlmC with PRC-barrel domain
VRCSDGDFGELADVVLQPASKRVTHLVVAPHGRPAEARLVPIALLRSGEPGGVELDGAVADVDALDAPRESAYLRLGEAPKQDDRWDTGIEQATALPFLNVDDGFGGAGPIGMGPDMVINYDRVPKGDVEIRRKSSVTSADGHTVGHVDGLVIDDAGGALTHVVLEHGHLWGKREVSIPIADVAGVRSDEVLLGLTKDEVGALEQVKPHPNT